jgi:hypothetical protein
MTRYRQSRQNRGVAAAPSQTIPSFDDTSDEDQNANENVASIPIQEEDENIVSDIHDEEKQLKANVWHYAKKLSTDKAQCLKCKIIIMTARGGTTTLRKHLINKHDLTHLSLRSSARPKKENSIPRERKIRLDHLANLAIFEDGRTFTDLRKNGIRKFLAEAIPGNSNRNTINPC